MVDRTHTQADTNICMEKRVYAPSHKCIEVNCGSIVSHTIFLSTYMFMFTQYAPLYLQSRMHHKHTETQHTHACEC